MTRKDRAIREERNGIKPPKRPYNRSQPDYLLSRPKELLTMVELKQLYKMYQDDCNIRTICLYIGIGKDYALECIEAAKWLYTWQLQRLKMERESIFKQRPPQRYFREEKRELFQRHKGEYSNRSPYGIAQKGSKESVTVTSLNAV